MDLLAFSGIKKSAQSLRGRRDLQLRQSDRVPAWLDLLLYMGVPGHPCLQSASRVLGRLLSKRKIPEQLLLPWNKAKKNHRGPRLDGLSVLVFYFYVPS